jgi:hypothetical protein
MMADDTDDTPTDAKDENSENSDGTDRAHNTTNNNSNNNNNNNNGANIDSSTNNNNMINNNVLPPLTSSSSPLPVPTTVVAIDNGGGDDVINLVLGSPSSPTIAASSTATSTVIATSTGGGVSFAGGARNTKLTAEALEHNDKVLQQHMDETQQQQQQLGALEVSSNLSRSSSESGMKNVLYKRQLQQQQQQQQEGGGEHRMSSSNEDYDISLNNSRHSNNNVFLPFGNNEDGVSSLGSLESRPLIVGGDPIVGDVDPATTTNNAVLYPSNSVLDSEGKGVINAVSAGIHTSDSDDVVAFSRSSTLRSSNATSIVAADDDDNNNGGEHTTTTTTSSSSNDIPRGMVKNDLSDAALDVVVTSALSLETPPKTNLSSARGPDGAEGGGGGGVAGENNNGGRSNVVVVGGDSAGSERVSPIKEPTFQFNQIQVQTELPPRTPTKIPESVTTIVPGTLLPMGSGIIEGGKIDPGSIRPPAPPHSPLPMAGSPMPPSAMRRLRDEAANPSSPSIHRLNNNNTLTKKTTFQEQPTTLTRTSSNASSTTVATNATSASIATRIRLGICAMDKKARSKPMSEILKRLDQATFDPVFFGDAVILNEPVESWPICDVLIAFYSNGYPLEKAEQYVALRRPYLINDLRMQRTLMDRRRVYDLLEESGIDVPRHVFLSRDGYVSTGTGDGVKDEDNEGGSIICREEPEFEEHDDHIEVNGVTINKPFVEKPVDADDHNIAIYYPSSAGGGCKKLFRKVGDRSSEFYPEINEIRRDGSYIYEEFIETQGTDVKMYTVGPDYGHAEARKSPTVDGKVERNPDGKEVRFPVILTLREKEIARRIVLQFKQQVCGFDILRIQEGDSLLSYVCDVNGWSFVKNSRKYYDDCAQILTEHMLALLKPKSLVAFSALAPLLTTVDDTHSRKKKKNHHRGASIADRVKTMLLGAGNASQNDTDDHEKDEENDKVSDLQTSDGGSTGNNFGLGEVHEEPVDFTPIRDLPNQLSTEPVSNTFIPSGASSLADPDDGSLGAKEDNVVSSTHEEELRCVITIVRHGDRTPKQKLKYVTDQERMLGYFHDHKKKVKKDLKVKSKKNMVEFLKMIMALIADLETEDSKENFQLLSRARHIRDILQRWQFSGLNRKMQMKPQQWEEVEVLDAPDGVTETRCSKLQLIVKWGGDLTKLGEKQAVQLGNRLRDELYPSNKGGGVLRLHSTFRHDLKIKTSDEGRVMKTAAGK